MPELPIWLTLPMSMTSSLAMLLSMAANCCLRVAAPSSSMIPARVRYTLVPCWLISHVIGMNFLRSGNTSPRSVGEAGRRGLPPRPGVGY